MDGASCQARMYAPNRQGIRGPSPLCPSKAWRATATGDHAEPYGRHDSGDRRSRWRAHRDVSQGATTRTQVGSQYRIRPARLLQLCGSSWVHYGESDEWHETAQTGEEPQAEGC